MTDQVSPDSECSFVEVMKVVGGKWRGTIIHCLGMGPRRFSELRRDVAPITQKMLTQELRALERDGLVSRVHHPEIPPRVVYSLTEPGQSLLSIFALIDQWKPNMDAVVDARARYDEQLESIAATRLPSRATHDRARMEMAWAREREDVAYQPPIRGHVCSGADPGEMTL